jgi:hypothetical protein
MKPELTEGAEVLLRQMVFGPRISDLAVFEVMHAVMQDFPGDAA